MENSLRFPHHVRQFHLYPSLSQQQFNTGTPPLHRSRTNLTKAIQQPSSRSWLRKLRKMGMESSSWTDMSLWKHVELRLTGSKLTYAYDKTNMFFHVVNRSNLISRIFSTHANGVHFTVVPKDAGQGVMVFKTTSEAEASVGYDVPVRVNLLQTHS